MQNESEGEKEAFVSENFNKLIVQKSTESRTNFKKEKFPTHFFFWHRNFQAYLCHGGFPYRPSAWQEKRLRHCWVDLQILRTTTMFLL